MFMLRLLLTRACSFNREQAQDACDLTYSTGPRTLEETREFSCLRGQKKRNFVPRSIAHSNTIFPSAHIGFPKIYSFFAHFFFNQTKKNLLRYSRNDKVLRTFELSNERLIAATRVTRWTVTGHETKFDALFINGDNIE